MTHIERPVWMMVLPRTCEVVKNFLAIEEHHRCFGFGGYFMAAVLAAASYSRIGFSLYFSMREWRVRVPGGSKFHLEPVTIQP